MKGLFSKKENANKTKAEKRKVSKSVFLKTGGFVASLIAVGGISNAVSSTPAKYAEAITTDAPVQRVETSVGTYVGDIENDLFTGKGTLQFLDGTQYAGEWENSNMSGEGEITYDGAGNYKGSFSDSVRSGNGTYTFVNGDTFKGIWDNDYPSNGIYTFADGSSYSGSFSKGERNGHGSASFTDGTTFSGSWSNDKMEKGDYTFPDGSVYSGTFADQKPDTGTYTAIPDGENVIELVIGFKDGEIDSIDYSQADGFSYNGAVSGETEVVFSNGDTYSGSVDNTKRSGEGTYTWMEDGQEVASYVGSWEDDLMSGTGVYYYSAETEPSIKGTFVSGKPDGSCTYTDGDGNTFTADFQDGNCVSVE